MARTEISYRGRGRSRPQGRFNFLRIPSGKASDGQSCWGYSRYIRSRARDHCDLVARPHRTQPTFGMAALRQEQPLNKNASILTIASLLTDQSKLTIHNPWQDR